MSPPTNTDRGAKRISFKVPLRYPLRLRDKADVRKVDGVVEECGIEHVAVSNATREMADAWDPPHKWAALELEYVSNCWVRDVRSFEASYSPPYHLRSFGLRVVFSKHVTVQDSHFARPQNRAGKGNGYMFALSATNEVLIKDCTGRHGRHNFSGSWPFGTSGNVWLRIQSSDALVYSSYDQYVKYEAWLADPTATPKPKAPTDHSFSDTHMHLTIANLVDNSVLDDGFQTMNRGEWSAFSGHTGTQNVLWNNRSEGKGGGKRRIYSYQYGWGYVIGTQGLDVYATPDKAPNAQGDDWRGDTNTEPYDFTEHLGTRLSVPSLYEDQLARRLGKCR